MNFQPLKSNFLNSLAPSLLLFALVFALYSTSIRYPLVNLDDYVYITQNRIVLQGLSPDNVRAAFVPANNTASMYMPLLWLSYMADVTLFGASPDNPIPFHVVNVTLHSISAVCLFLLLRRLRTAPFWAFLLTLLWAVHPLRVESVAWVTERKDVLSAVFGLAATLLYLHTGEMDYSPTRPRRILLYSASTLLYVLGLLAKPSLVPLPLAWIAFDVWPLRRIPSSLGGGDFSRKLFATAAAKLPALVCAVGAARLAVTQHHAVSGALAIPWPYRLAAVAPNFLFYLRKTLFPVNLSPLVPEQWIFPLPQILVALLVCAILAAALWRMRNGLPSLIPGTAWLLLFFLPASGLQPLPTNTVADRFFYLPAIGISIALSSLFPHKLQRHGGLREGKAEPVPRTPDMAPSAFFLSAMLFLVVSFSIVTLRILPTWSSTLALYERVVKTFPDHSGAITELARHDIDSSGNFDAAESKLHPVLERDSGVCATLFLYADCLLHRDSPDAALEYLLNTPAPVDLGSIATRYSRLAHYAYFKGDFSAALGFARQALPLYADDSIARTTLLFLCIATAYDAGDTAQALAFARQTPVFANLDAISLEHLLPFAIFLWVDSYRDQAAALFFRILDAYPDRPDIANNILWGFATSDWSPVPSSIVLERTQRMRDVSPFPDHPAILDTLAAALANDGKFPAALQAIALALSQVSSDSPFHQALRQRQALYRENRPCRENGFERLFSASFGPAVNAL